MKNENVSSIDEYKQKKLDKKILEDIDYILRVIEESKKALQYFKHYSMVIVMLGELETNKRLMLMYKKKYEKNSSSDTNK